jgi:hypothetical protein
VRELGCNDKGNGLLQEKLAITSSSTAKLTRSFTAASSLSLAVRVEPWVLSFACAGGSLAALAGIGDFLNPILENHLFETIGTRVLRCCSTPSWGSALGFRVGRLFWAAGRPGPGEAPSGYASWPPRLCTSRC